MKGPSLQRFDGVHEHEAAEFLEVDDDAIPLDAALVIGDLRAAEFHILEAGEVQLLRARFLVVAVVVEEVPGAGFGALDALPPDDAVVVDVGAEAAVGQVVAVAAFVEEGGAFVEQEHDGVLVGVAVVHLFGGDGQRGAQIAARDVAVAQFVAVVEHQVGGVGIPSAAEEDFLADEIVEDFLAAPRGLDGGDVVVGPFVGLDAVERVADAVRARFRRYGGTSGRRRT